MGLTSCDIKTTDDSNSSIRCFFLSLDVCAATRFFNFLKDQARGYVNQAAKGRRETVIIWVLIQH